MLILFASVQLIFWISALFLERVADRRFIESSLFHKDQIFSDYSYVVRLATENDATLAGSHNPATLVHHLFQAISNSLGIPGEGLGLYLIAIVIFSLSPIIYARKWFSVPQLFLALVAFGPFSVAFLGSLDRGNSVGFIVPFLFFAGHAYLENEMRRLVVLIVVLSLLKPQFVVLLALLLIKREYRKLLVASGAVLVSQALGFIVFWTHFPENVWATFQFRGDYATSTPLSTDWPVNISIPRGTYQLLTVAGPSTNAELVGIAIAVVIVLACFVFFFFNGSHNNSFVVFSVVSAAAALLVPVSWFYYSVFAISLGLLLFHPKALRTLSSSQLGGDVAIDRFMEVALVSAIGYSLARVPVQGKYSIAILADLGFVVTSASSIGVVWLLSLAAVGVCVASQIVQRSFRREAQISGQTQKYLRNSA